MYRSPARCQACSTHDLTGGSAFRESSRIDLYADTHARDMTASTTQASRTCWANVQLRHPALEKLVFFCIQIGCKARNAKRQGGLVKASHEELDSCACMLGFTCIFKRALATALPNHKLKKPNCSSCQTCCRLPVATICCSLLPSGS